VVPAFAIDPDTRPRLREGLRGMLKTDGEGFLYDASAADRAMAVLRRRYPAYADVLSIRASTTYELLVAGTGVACRARDGTWLHGPGDPWTLAQRDARALVDGETRLYVVLRPGLGYAAAALLGALKWTPESVLLVVEDRLDLLRVAFGVLDWEELLSSEACELLLGDPLHVVVDFLKHHAALSLLPTTLIVDPTATGEEERADLALLLSEAAQRCSHALNAQLDASATVRSRRRSRAIPNRVVLAGPDFGYLGPPIAAGFCAAGCDVAILDDHAPGNRAMAKCESLQWILGASPDMVLWMNRPGLSSLAAGASRELGVANVLWSVDSPRRMGLTESELRLADLHACFDEHYVQNAPAPVLQLSLAAGIAPLRACVPDAACWPERQGPDVSFVGALGWARLERLRESLHRRERLVLNLLERLAADAGDPAAAFEAETGCRYEGSVCLYVEERRTMLRRLRVLRALPRDALVIFGGPEWRAHGDAVACRYAGGPLRYDSELASAYYHSRINMNVFHAQCVDSTNSRVYDVLAAGGFLITEHRPILEREFVLGEHLVTFKTVEEARSLVEYYLVHDAEREAIARAGQRHVLATHTLARRCAELLRHCSPIFSRETP
jgi:glycosyl transferase family 1